VPNSKQFNLDQPLTYTSPSIDVRRNDNFPIHVDFRHDQADMDKNKPGGIFVKKMYEPGYRVDVNNLEMPKDV